MKYVQSILFLVLSVLLSSCIPNNPPAITEQKPLSERISCYAIEPAEYDEWDKKIQSIFIGSEGIYNLGGICNLKDGGKVVSFIPRKNPSGFAFALPNSPQAAFLATFTSEGTLKNAVEGELVFGGDTSACIPQYIEGNSVYLICRSADGSEEAGLTEVIRKYSVDFVTGERSLLSRSEKHTE